MQLPEQIFSTVVRMKLQTIQTPAYILNNLGDLLIIDISIAAKALIRLKPCGSNSLTTIEHNLKLYYSSFQFLPNFYQRFLGS